MSASEVSLSPLWSARTPRLRTWHVLLILALVILALNAVHRDVVMTRTTYDALFSTNMDKTALGRRWALYRRMDVWSYPAAIVLLVVQLGLITLLVQLGLILAGVEVSFRRVWGAAVIAQIALVVKMAWTVAYQAGLDPAHITAAAFYQTPLTLASWIPAESGVARAVTRSLNLFEIVWAALLYWRLSRLERVSRGKALSVTGGLLLLLNSLQVGIMLYLQRLGL